MMKLKRSIAKAITYKMLSVALACIVMFWVTGSIEIAAKGLLIISPLTFVLYIVHERIWLKFKWGKEDKK